MPTFEATQILPRPVAEVFAFFRRPSNLIAVSPPELHMTLAGAPPLLELGSRMTLRGRRWGIPQTIVSQVTEFIPGVAFKDIQIEGPFRKWEHTHSFEALDGGTKVTDRIEFDPPGGLLGLVVTVSAIESDLTWIFEHRRKKLAELLG